MNGRSIEEYKRRCIENYMKPASERDPNLNDPADIPRLATATNGHGLRKPVNEAEARKRAVENSAYSISAKRVRTERDMEDYQKNLSTIKIEAEEQVRKPMGISCKIPSKFSHFQALALTLTLLKLKSKLSNRIILMGFYLKIL